MDASTSQWSWPEGITTPPVKVEEEESSSARQPESSAQSATATTSFPTPQEPLPQPKREPESSTGSQDPPPRQRQRRHYPNRECRICFDEVEPRFSDEDNGTLGGFMGSGSKPVYISDPELGRLISPCKCKGSAKYVHEGCLQGWRTAGGAATDNPHFFTCPTCKYNYQLGRLSWGRRLQSSFTRLFVTISIFVLSIFLLGFVADPIFRLWNDPVGTLADTVVGVLDDIEATSEPPVTLAEHVTWWEHFVKGFLSLGILGFLKYLLAMTPWQWWNIRSSGLMGGTVRRGGGRARAENISWALVMIGAMTFIYSVWKAVNAVTAQILQRAGDRVLDVDDDNDEDADKKNE